MTEAAAHKPTDATTPEPFRVLCIHKYDTDELCWARRFTEEERSRYKPEYQARGAYRVSDRPSTELPHLRYADYRDVFGGAIPYAGWFPGSHSSIVAVTEEQWQAIAELEQERQNQERAEAERAEREQAEKEAAFEALLSRADSWEAGEKRRKPSGEYGCFDIEQDITVTVHGTRWPFRARNVFDVGLVINPRYPIGDNRTPGGLATTVDGELWWMDFTRTDDWINVRAMEPDEALAYRIACKLAARNGLGRIRL